MQYKFLSILKDLLLFFLKKGSLHLEFAAGLIRPHI